MTRSRWVLWTVNLVLIGLAVLFTVFVSPWGAIVLLGVIMAAFHAARNSKGGPTNFPDIRI